MAASKKTVAIIPPQMKYDRNLKVEQKMLRVAAYCRVSTTLEQQEGSYEAQVDYYTTKINNNPNWKCARIFADDGKSATGTAKRDDFNALIDACMQDKIDLVLTKSVSRFARNTVDALQNIRKLKEKNIPIIFEKEGINTMESGGELLITILSSQAQEESRNISENTRWGVTRRFENGQISVNHKKFLGYTKDEDGNLVVVPDEAVIVKRIYREYLEGKSIIQIARGLGADGIKTVTGLDNWHPGTIDKMLSNEKLCGDALLQKTYTVDFLTKKRVKNDGYVQQYYVEDNHEAIIPKELFNQVQAEKARRASLSKSAVARKKQQEEKEKSRYSSKYVLTELLICASCGHAYRRQIWSKYGDKSAVWRCEDRLRQGKKSKCQNSPTIKEEQLHHAIMKAINDVVENTGEFIGTFRDNVIRVIGNHSTQGVSTEYDEQIELLQKQMLTLIEDNARHGAVSEEFDDEYKHLSEQINKLKTEKIKAVQAQKKVESYKERVEKIDMAITTVNPQVREFDQDLVKRLIASIKVHKNMKLEIQFHSGIVVKQEIDSPYQRYLKNTCSDVGAIHKGYFSIDKKTGRSVDSQIKRGSDSSDDISAYDLILKNKERLLSFDEPTRFIFSHSALREGWDNPNVFQICTLKHSDSQTMKRQEVGRGLRLCVNQDGNRMDAQSCGDSVHDINMLTVVASESYKNFVSDLQADIKTVLYDRPTVATSEYFKGKYVKVNDVPTIIDSTAADAIEFYLISNGYVDMKRKVTDKYRTDVAMGNVAKLPEELAAMTDGIHTLIQAVYDDSILESMFSDGHETKVKDNPLNDNFAKKEFQTLWKQINHKYAYTASFDSAELIDKSVKHINEKLFVSELQYTTTIGRQKQEMNEYEVERGASFSGEKTRTQTLKHAQSSQIKYDLIGKIAEGTTLTRKTTTNILKGLEPDKIYMFKNNPEEFISKVVKLIKEQKATMIVEHISYDQLEGEYDSTIFTAEKSSQSFDKAFRANKAIQDYVFTDGTAEQSIERRFVGDLDAADEVCVYAKLPKGFHIPTPVGNYSPDWAIAFYEGTVKHIFFIAETKGTMDSLNLRPIEQAKISCAKKLFNEISTNDVKYHDVDSYQSLLNVMKSM